MLSWYRGSCVLGFLNCNWSSFQIHKNCPASAKKVMEQDAELQRHVLVIHPTNYWPKLPCSQLNSRIIPADFTSDQTPRSSINYETIVHHKKYVVPRWRNQLLQKYLLSNSFLACLSFENFIHYFVKKMCKWPRVCKSIEHKKKKSSQLKLLNSRNLLRY